jgi:hypothetical protein
VSGHIAVQSARMWWFCYRLSRRQFPQLTLTYLDDNLLRHIERNDVALSSASPPTWQSCISEQEVLAVGYNIENLLSHFPSNKFNLMFVWPCIIYGNDEMYQLDATVVIYYHKYLYMFRAPICPSSGAVSFRLKSETNLHTVHKTTHRLLRTTTTTPSAEHHMQ